MIDKPEKLENEKLKRKLAIANKKIKNYQVILKSRTESNDSAINTLNQQKLTEKALRESQERYRSLFQTVSDPIFVLDKETGDILEANGAACATYGYSIEELLKLKNTDMSAEPEKTRHATDIAEGHKNLIPVRYHKTKSGMIFPVEITANSIQLDNREVLLVSARDITERIKIEQVLVESEEKFRLLYTSMDQALALHEIHLDENGQPVDYVFLDVNDSYTRLFGVKRDMVIGKKITEVMPDSSNHWIEDFGKVALTGKPHYFECYEEDKGKYHSYYSYCPKKNQFAVLVSDITDRKKNESKIQYFSFHDQLTGLYNLRFYEEELTRLDTPRNYPLTIVMGDVNGLKLINDSFGHAVGDELLKKAAEVIRKGCRADDIVARIGGDEFVLILPRTEAFEAEQLIMRIKDTLLTEKLGTIDVSISFGFSTKDHEDLIIQDVFKKAEDSMYYNKLFESPLMKEKTVDIIIKTLYGKNAAEEQRSIRVAKLCEKMGEALGLPKKKIKDLKTVGSLYDIGKVAIDEKILKKPGKLTEDEWNKIRRHPEIGYRILSTVNEMSEIAGYVLDHHERWDGEGYPRILKGEEIALESRIMAIADAYDAMTNIRSYRSALSEEAAQEELRRNAGAQFDPELVEVFIEKVLRTH